MKFREILSLPRGGALVLLIHQGEPIVKHPFFRLSPKADQDYLNLFAAKTFLAEEGIHRALTSSGRDLIILVLPKRGEFNHRKAILAARQIIKFARAERLAELIFNFDDFRSPLFVRKEAELAETLATQMVLADFEFIKYKTPPPAGWHFVETIDIFSTDPLKILNSLARGVMIGEEINAARALANTPGGDMTPAKLAEAAVAVGKRAKFKVEVLDEPKIKALKMGGVLGVSKGSAERPRFIVMEYLKGDKKDRPIVLVGKGITFDTGGLNLKPSEHIYEMHMDMSGGAAVIHAMAALARLGVKKNFIGLIPAVENMPSGSSYRPGDVLTSMSGKTIKVMDTDAEGRIILADALTYAERYKPRLVIDLATLTGAATVALGQHASALFTPDPQLAGALTDMGERSGDYVWPLPLFEEVEGEIKADFADWSNTGKDRYGGALRGATFLRQFIKNYPWVHLDIAPRMTATDKEFLAKGATGTGVALLARFLQIF